MRSLEAWGLSLSNSSSSDFDAHYYQLSYPKSVTVMVSVAVLLVSLPMIHYSGFWRWQNSGLR